MCLLQKCVYIDSCMSEFSQIRLQIVHVCFSLIEEKRNAIEKELCDIRESTESETKRSVGDKHETARARMQAEIERLGQQLFEINIQKAELERLSAAPQRSGVAPGSIVFTNAGVFFIAIALGKIHLAHDTVQVISVKSPLALQMMGLQMGNTLVVNGHHYSIQQIV